MSVAPSEVRIEHSVDDQKALGRSFLVFYAVLAGVLLVVSVVVNPELLLGAVFFAGFIAWWGWRLRRHQEGAVPWVLVLTPTELRHTWEGGDTTVTRPEATEVRIRTRSGGRGSSVQVLQVDGPDGATLLTASLPRGDAPVMLEAAFEEWGWPFR